MNLEFTYQNQRRSESVEAYVKDALFDFQPMNRQVESAMAELIRGRDGKSTVKLGIKAPKVFRGLVSASHENLYAAINSATDKLKRRFKKSVGKLARESRKPQEFGYDDISVSELEIEAENVIKFNEALRKKRPIQGTKVKFSNKELVEILSELCLRLACLNSNKKTLREIKHAISRIQSTNQSVHTLFDFGEDLEKSLKIAKPIAAKIEELLRNREMVLLNNLRQVTPDEVGDLTSLKGIGPKKAQVLFDAAGVRNTQDLEQLAWSGMVKNIPGFSTKAELRIVNEIAKRKINELL